MRAFAKICRHNVGLTIPWKISEIFLHIYYEHFNILVMHSLDYLPEVKK